MKNARTIGFGILAAVACTLAFAGGCATDEAATTKEGCSEGATCAEKTACCQEKAASECCAKEGAAKQPATSN